MRADRLSIEQMNWNLTLAASEEIRKKESDTNGNIDGRNSKYEMRNKKYKMSNISTK